MFWAPDSCVHWGDFRQLRQLQFPVLWSDSTVATQALTTGWFLGFLWADFRFRTVERPLQVFRRLLTSFNRNGDIGVQGSPEICIDLALNWRVYIEVCIYSFSVFTGNPGWSMFIFEVCTYSFSQLFEVYIYSSSVYSHWQYGSGYELGVAVYSLAIYSLANKLWIGSGSEHFWEWQ